ncbi:MAG: hypothetical protein K0R55_239 [Sporomusa sp.]|nr:hypothetical protein [Sporomusa sp.]
MTGEFDNDFLEEVKAMSPSPQDKQIMTTVPTEEAHNALIAEQQHEIIQAKQEIAANKRKTYLSSEIPVRPCTNDCPKRSTCRDFGKGRVSDGDLCKPELRQIKKWQVAFRQGNIDKIKDDAGAVAGALAIQIYRLIEQAIIDGAVVESTKEGKFGTYKEKMAHPALQQAANICKTLGINLNDFLMTPRSGKDAGPQVNNINVGVTFNVVQDRFAARYGQVTVKE